LIATKRSFWAAARNPLSPAFTAVYLRAVPPFLGASGLPFGHRKLLFGELPITMSASDLRTQVSLAKRVPVFIVYGTALAYENGDVHFSDDIYGHDAKLAVALAKGYPYE
jgi:hypothetical protein